MSNGNGHRWSKFWWCDWQNDKALQLCSLAARGLWIEMLGLCHASERPGYLLVNGEAPDANALADMLGRTTAKEVTKLLEELERRRVFSRTTEGIIYSRRMVKDAAASEAGREHIEKRWNSANPTHPPNNPPNRGPTSRPNGEATSYPNSQAYRPPGSPPIPPPGPPLSEAEAELEAEGREEVSLLRNLSSSSPVLARVAAACETPQAGTYSEPTLQIATQTVVEKLARKLESSGKNPQGRSAKLTIVQQIDAVRLGPLLDDEPTLLDGEILDPPLRRGPLPPQRTVAEQLAALGFPQMMEAAE